MPLSVAPHECVILVEADGALDATDLAVLTTAIDGFVARRERFLVVGDALRATSITAGARKFVGEHRTGMRDAVHDLDLGLVLALGSPVLRGAVTAITWFSGEFRNLRTVDRRTELAPAARALLTKHAVTLGRDASASLDAFSERRPAR